MVKTIYIFKWGAAGYSFWFALFTRQTYKTLRIMENVYLIQTLHVSVFVVMTRCCHDTNLIYAWAAAQGNLNHFLADKIRTKREIHERKKNHLWWSANAVNRMTPNMPKLNMFESNKTTKWFIELCNRVHYVRTYINSLSTEVYWLRLVIARKMFCSAAWCATTTTKMTDSMQFLIKAKLQMTKMRCISGKSNIVTSHE